MRIFLSFPIGCSRGSTTSTPAEKEEARLARLDDWEAAPPDAKIPAVAPDKAKSDAKFHHKAKAKPPVLKEPPV